MLKKAITYQDLDGNDVTEEFYFNLSKAEIAELELSVEGGLAAQLAQILKDNQPGQIIKSFKRIIMLSVGRRSEDGKRFIKNDEVRDEFMQTDAYSVMFMELCTDAVKAAEFIKGVIPADVAARVDVDQSMGLTPTGWQPQDLRVSALEAPPKKLSDYSQDELQKMPRHELTKLIVEAKKS